MGLIKLFLFNLNTLITSAQKGDPLCREKLIKKHYHFIAKICSKVCKRYLIWENDDELSIGLLAFNEAIDAFDTAGDVKFSTFAGVVIKRRLIDYFRHQAKFEKEVLSSTFEEKNELKTGINAKSLSLYNDDQTKENLAGIITYYQGLLVGYGIDIGQLPEVSPKHRDTRENLLQAAIVLSRNPDMLDYLQKYGQVPVKLLCASTGLSRKIIERGRKYIIAITLILSDPILSPLKRFTNFYGYQGEKDYGEDQSNYRVV